MSKLTTMPVGFLGRNPNGEHIPMELFTPHERQAGINHYQSLRVLASRGGLSWCEAAAILDDRPWHRMSDAEAEARVRQLAGRTALAQSEDKENQ